MVYFLNNMKNLLNYLFDSYFLKNLNSILIDESEFLILAIWIKTEYFI